MTTSDALQRLAVWYSSHCDGDWEHDWRVRIGTVDNPGWSIDVNLVDTFSHPLELERVRVERSSADWCSCWMEGEVFRSVGGPENLPELVTRFLNWIQRYEEVDTAAEGR